MLTGAALATINRLPVLLLPADTFAGRSASPLLQELELPDSGDITVNDAFRPVSRYFDRIWRPEQLPAALMSAMGVLTNPAETGAVTLCFPQDVQAEAHDWPGSLFEKRVWHVARPLPERAMLEAAAAVIRSAKKPLIVAGGGVHYSGATDALARLCEATGIPVGQSQAGKGTLIYDHPQCLGAIGSTGTTAANAIARDADVVIGIGTRYSDFTTASRTAFQNPDVRFVNINVAGMDVIKHAGLGVQQTPGKRSRPCCPCWMATRWTRATAGRSPSSMPRGTKPYAAPTGPSPEITGRGAGSLSRLLTQNEVIGMVNELSDPRDVVVCAAGSMPGDLHKLWRTRDPKGYHVEYGYSCMGYEVAGGLGVRLACPDRDVFVMVGDGSYLMMATELATAVQEGIKIITVLVQNHGYASIGALSESLGSQRFGTRYRYRNPETGRLDGEKLPIDLAANAASFGLEVFRTSTPAEFADAIKAAKAATESVVIYVETDPLMRLRTRSPGGTCRSARRRRSTPLRTLARPMNSTKPPNDSSCKRALCQRSESAPLRTPGACGSRSDPAQLPAEQFLREVVAAGYGWIELGPYGYLPTDPAQLQDQLDAHQLKVLAGTVFEHLHRPNSWDDVWAQVTDVAALTQAVGGKHIVVIPDTWRHHKTGEDLEDRELPRAVGSADRRDERTRAAHPRRVRAGGAASPPRRQPRRLPAGDRAVPRRHRFAVGQPLLRHRAYRLLRRRLPGVDQELSRIGSAIYTSSR